VAGAVWRVQNLVVEHGEVKGQSQADGVSGGQLGLGNVGGVLQAGVSVDCAYTVFDAQLSSLTL
jgi:hypothetical protein